MCCKDRNVAVLMASSINRIGDLILVIPFYLDSLCLLNNACKKGGGKIYGKTGRFGRIAISSLIIVFCQADKLGIINTPFHPAIDHIIIGINGSFNVHRLYFGSLL